MSHCIDQFLLKFSPEVYFSHLENPDFLAEHIIDMDPDKSEVPHSIKLIDELHWFPIKRIIPPSYPLIAFNSRTTRVKPKIRLSWKYIGCHLYKIKHLWKIAKDDQVILNFRVRYKVCYQVVFWSLYVSCTHKNNVLPKDVEELSEFLYNNKGFLKV